MNPAQASRLPTCDQPSPGKEDGEPSRIDGESPARQEERVLRVVGWNFLEGGLCRPGNNGRRQPHGARRAAAVSLVRQLAPDILVLNEALGCQQSPEANPHTDYGRLFGFQYQAGALYNGNWGNVILSRFPLLDSKVGAIPDGNARRTRGWLAALAQTPLGPVWIGTYHPHPEREPLQRRKDAGHLLDAMEGPAIFAGDLNATHPDYPLQEDLLLPVFVRLHGSDRAFVSMKAFAEAGRQLLGQEEGVFPERGWKVANTHGVATVPTALVRHPGDPGLGLDHVALSPHLSFRSARVAVHADADKASDHYPVIAEVVPGNQG